MLGPELYSRSKELGFDITTQYFGDRINCEGLALNTYGEYVIVVPWFVRLYVEIIHEI